MPISIGRIVKETNSKIVVSSSWRCGDLQFTKISLMEYGLTQFLSDQIVSETTRKHNHIKDGSSLEICRGNEIATWVSQNLKYPWHAHPELDANYRTYKEDGSFKMMRSNKAGVDYSYVILDDDTDMLLCQNRSQCNRIDSNTQ